jgi:FKBP-type peptidyl-prolyl cis-trans isomerase FklB
MTDHPNKTAGEAFLADNAKHDDVNVTASGLQYAILDEADGPKPKATDTVEVHYHGTFINNKKFDSSYERGQPAMFPLNGVIAGWTEGLQLMSVGSRYKFYIPYHLAYGEKGYPGAIPPYSTLIFEVELLAIK